MAGGKVSARQKMINLMYLVFIAMMAMQMSKEVLSSFGQMEEKFAMSNVAASETNKNMLEGLEGKAKEKKEKFAVPYALAQDVSRISNSFYAFLAEVKEKDILDRGKFERDERGSLPFQSMEKGDFLDEYWFTGDRPSKRGQAIVDRIEQYKAEMNEIFDKDKSYLKVQQNFNKRFDLSEVENADGKKLGWLEYNFNGYPSIASYTKLTAMQNDVKASESAAYNLFLGNSLEDAITLRKYKAIVLADKSAFFAGEKFKGKVVIGKYENVTPTKLTVKGSDINIGESIDSLGAVKLDFNVGNVGEHTIDGEFTFIENGENLKIPIEANYVVVPRPNSATISADKMNVVYRGVVNPMTISFAGVPDNKVTANATGLVKKGNGKYEMRPGAGREVVVSVSAKLDDGSTSTDKATFRIKDIPRPTGTVRGESGTLKMSKNNLSKVTIGAMLEDFDFDLKLNVRGFSFKVPGQATIKVNGNKLDSRARASLLKAKRGQTVQVFDINAKLATNSSYFVKKVTPVIIEITN
ncbi:gliding motility protein GldM [Kordia sp.]|uniref:type IX secretion system motor protein PorM/GldM n=1 Tax=Kordia sp. TaxID=1965332 RepID=UPI003D2E5255